jgi:hypothetical protein
MNPFHILRESFRITFRAWTPWVLAFLLYLVMIPALVLAGGMGAVASYGMLPARNNPIHTLNLPLPDFSTLEWVLFLAVSLILLTVTSLLAWAIQAAMIRAADAAADGKPLSVLDALRLGKGRWWSLLKLAFTFGLVIQAMGILPALLAIVLRENTAWGSAVMPLVQTFLSPVNLVLGIFVFLLMMSIALEDSRPGTAFRRIGELVRSGWWGFLLAYVVQAILALIVAFIIAFILAVVLILFTAAWLSNSAAGTAIAVAICVLASPIGLALLTFVMVFSTVYFTLTYRAAAAHPPEQETRIQEYPQGGLDEN